ncbi:hypothetical protein [Aliarcobacter cryaerophilus]|jgi:hypothetical protein|nr:hypothetical protein [Aliarcobacter cryaerophilus]
MTYFALVKKGYGSLNQIKQLDTDELMNIINYENMMNDIEYLVHEDRQQS